MKKMNKKGFTLIEMLVVIAIIAVLVAIIIPTVSNATTKASAAANAANLRSYLAEIQIAHLSDPSSVTTGTNNVATVDGITAPKSKAVGGVAKDVAATAKIDANGVVTVYFSEAKFDIDYFADIAETGKVPTPTTPKS